MHNRYTEQIYVLDGEFTVWTGGGRKTVLHRGDDIVIPRGTAHALYVTGATQLRRRS
jgi:quercetin dioxygenase-like cupin family protein